LLPLLQHFPPPLQQFFFYTPPAIQRVSPPPVVKLSQVHSQTIHVRVVWKITLCLDLLQFIDLIVSSWYHLFLLDVMYVHNVSI
jgi:hypothetical protein